MNTSTKTIYLVRHGQTPWTKAERVQGWAPIPLNDTGKKQIRATANHLSDGFMSQGPIRIETSDLRRARESAEIIQETLDSPCKISDQKKLRERNFGVFQGLDDVRYHRLKEGSTGLEFESLLKAPENGESWREVETRVLDIWEKLLHGMAEEQTMILVSHTGPMYCILASIEERRLEVEMANRSLEEASIYEIIVEDQECRLANSGWSPSI